ncbi:MAG: Sec-independent protein translocase protein TatB [Epsilonproteobacteria bacterium]|nr:Sec-independent protein translocase protein TatB [Campylobacterota bacterium]
MFGMSFGEILIIAIIAILFLGPEKLPDAMVKIAKFFKSFKKSVNDAKDTIEQEMHLAELKEGAISYKQQLEESVNDVKKDINVVDDLNEKLDDITGSITKLDEPEKPKKVKKSTKKKDKEDV